MKARITITLEDDGKVGINGPLEDKMFCLRLLNIAYDLVSEYKAEKRIVEPSIMTAGMKRN